MFRKLSLAVPQSLYGFFHSFYCCILLMALEEVIMAVICEVLYHEPDIYATMSSCSPSCLSRFQVSVL
jgi:hypothetical protein